MRLPVEDVQVHKRTARHAQARFKSLIIDRKNANDNVLEGAKEPFPDWQSHLLSGSKISAYRQHLNVALGESNGLSAHLCTDIMIKPDGVQRGLVGEIIKRFEAKGYKLVAMKLTAPGREHMETH